MSCEAELCAYWGGMGCVCDVMDLEPRVVGKTGEYTESGGWREEDDDD